jgi:hypothetical protein
LTPTDRSLEPDIFLLGRRGKPGTNVYEDGDSDHAPKQDGTHREKRKKDDSENILLVYPELGRIKWDAKRVIH